MKTFLTLLLFFLCFHGHSQNFDSLVRANPVIDCRDVEFNAPDLVRNMYEKKDFDGMDSFRQYWITQCGEKEEQFRLTLLRRILSGQFSSDSVSFQWIRQLEEYKSRRIFLVNVKNDTAGFSRYFFYPFMDSLYLQNALRYDEVSRLMASEAPYNGSRDEKLLLHFLSSEVPDFSRIAESDLGESKLRQYYDMRIKDIQSQVLIHYGVITGVNLMAGNQQQLGTKGNFGLFYGLKQKRNSFDLLMDFRFGKAKDPYEVEYLGNIISVDVYTGMYLGLEYAYDIIQRDKFELAFSPGIAYDRITSLYVDNEFGEEAKFINGYNFNAGLKTRFYIGKNGTYIGTDFRANLVNYNNEPGTNLSGQIFNIRLTLGWLSKSLMTRPLSLLDYSSKR